MLETIFIYIFLFFISFFPIVIWAYSFSFIDDNPLNKKRFLVWILWWILSVIPILHIDKIMKILDFDYLNVFYFASKIWNLFSSLEFWLSLSLFLFLVVLFSFFLWWFFKNRYFKSITRNKYRQAHRTNDKILFPIFCIYFFFWVLYPNNKR